MGSPHFESILPLLIAIATLLAMISLRNGDVAIRARNCRDELLYKVDTLIPSYDPSLALDDAQRQKRDEAIRRAERRRKNLRQQIDKFHWRYRLMSAAFILLVFAAAGVGLYGTEVVGSLLGRGYERAILWSSIGLFIVGILMTVAEMWVGPQALELNSQD